MRGGVSALRRSPVWLWVAAAAIGVEEVVFLVGSPVDALSASSVVVTVVLAWLLLRGSRVVWIVLLIGSVGQLAGPLLDEPGWTPMAGAITMVCLLAPPSRRFVWRKRPWLPRNQVGSAALRAYTWMEVRARYLAAKVTGDEDLSLVSGKVIWPLLIVVLLLMPVDGALYNSRHDENRDGLLVEILSRTFSLAYGILELTLIVLLVVAAYRYLKSKWGSRADGDHPAAEQTAER